ncbi:PREDICTED: protein male-specific lethal-3 isoform X2 [Rhagoletis zephyria]|uniref:protein male-specific lethal-3 isoform X2 n=1 Tax=Rhagoletis zephyria TaxID=28612 RepID=UPI0008119A18|nr:PREDICTED: protein male-specific lethal-3 isoform X2 [Rhagoletis zephyria]
MAQRSRHSYRSGASTRYFEKGEKVLCYEPDPTKAKVLYDSKILGWSSSWDRKVNADFVLKDTEENRQLQRDLAEKAQLQINAFLYRKERTVSKKKQNKSLLSTDDATAAGGNANSDQRSSPKSRTRGSSEDNFSSSSTFERQEDFPMKDECETESCCSSVESFPDEERVLLRISERLRQYLEYDHDMITKYCKQHALPARIPVVAILENFVKHSVVKMVFSTTQVESTRRRSTQQRTNKKEHEFDKLVATASLLKEVADGLRIYFDFTIADYLLYKEEKEYALSYLSADNLKNFTYVALPGLSPDFLNPNKNEGDTTQFPGGDSCTETQLMEAASTTPAPTDEPQKRKSRLHRSDDCEMILENCLENCFSSIASTSSGASTPLHSAVGGGGASSGINYLKSLQPMALNIPSQTKDFLQTVLSWNLLPTDAPAAPSMIFGAPHLARLIVKLPEFLNASSINDDKLKVLLQHLDTFVNYLEARKEWFNEDNYARSNAARKRANSSEGVKSTLTDISKETLDANLQQIPTTTAMNSTATSTATSSVTAATVTATTTTTTTVAAIAT